MTTDALTIDPDHVYRWQGRKVRGVTEILKAVGVTDHSGPWFDSTAKEYGSNLHRCLALLVAGTLDMESVDPRILAEVTAVAEFLERLGHYQVLAVEWMAYSTTYGFAGMLDCALRLSNGRVALIDWKRGVADKAARLQTTLYAVLLNEASIREAFSFHIPSSMIDRFALDGIKTGKPKVRAFTDRSDIAGALGMVALCNWADGAGLKLQGERNGN